MVNVIVKMAAISAAFLLVSCNMLNPPPERYVQVQPTVVEKEKMMGRREVNDRHPGGSGQVSTVVHGNMGSNMDSIDKSKLSHALDKPLGKSTTWTNANTGIEYTVVPVKKVTINGNSFCRQYQVSAGRGENKKSHSGTACVAQDGQWESVG